MMVVAVEPHKIAYFPVPKAACTSVKTALAALDPAVDHDGQNGIMEVHSVYPTRRFRRERFAEYDGWFRFAVLRDPLKRLLSVYTDIVAGREALKTAAAFRRGRTALTAESDADYFFQNLEEYAAQVSVIGHHTRPHQTYVGRRLEQYSKVYRTSDMAAMASDLSEVTGQEIVIPRLNRSREKLSFDTLAGPTQEALRQRVGWEYDLYGTYFTRPWQ